MTTNLGTRDISRGRTLGFANADDTKTSHERMKARSTTIEQHFRPEFLNDRRHHRLPPAHAGGDRRDCRPDAGASDERLRDKDMGIELTKSAKELLAARGYDPVLGARPLRRTIQRKSRTHSAKILFGDLGPGQIVVVDVEVPVRTRPSRSPARPSPRCRIRHLWRPPALSAGRRRPLGSGRAGQPRAGWTVPVGGRVYGPTGSTNRRPPGRRARGRVGPVRATARPGSLLTESRTPCSAAMILPRACRSVPWYVCRLVVRCPRPGRPRASHRHC